MLLSDKSPWALLLHNVAVWEGWHSLKQTIKLKLCVTSVKIIIVKKITKHNLISKKKKGIQNHHCHVCIYECVVYDVFCNFYRFLLIVWYNNLTCWIFIDCPIWTSKQFHMLIFHQLSNMTWQIHNKYQIFMILTSCSIYISWPMRIHQLFNLNLSVHIGYPMYYKLEHVKIYFCSHHLSQWHLKIGK